MEQRENESTKGSSHLDNEQLYRTHDVDVASFLSACRGAELLRIEAPQPNEFPRLSRFVFLNSETLQAAIAEWISDEPLVGDLRPFISARREFFRRLRERGR